MDLRNLPQIDSQSVNFQPEIIYLLGKIRTKICSSSPCESGLGKKKKGRFKKNSITLNCISTLTCVCKSCCFYREGLKWKYALEAS